MTKYIIIKYTPDGYGGKRTEIKTVRKSELKSHLKNGWVLDEKIIPFITPFKKWWNKFTMDNKLVILSILIPSLIAIVFGVLAYRTDKKNNLLELENKTLNEDYIQLKQTLILTSDSLNIERQKFESTIKKLQSKTSSDKNPAEKTD